MVLSGQQAALFIRDNLREDNFRKILQKDYIVLIISSKTPAKLSIHP